MLTTIIELCNFVSLQSFKVKFISSKLFSKYKKFNWSLYSYNNQDSVVFT